MGRALLLLIALSAPAGADVQVVPQFEAGLGHTGESLTVPISETDEMSTSRELFTTRLALGVGYGPFEEMGFGGGDVHLRSALTADVSLTPGRWALGVEQDLRWRRPLGPLALSVGPGLAARLDLEKPQFSTLAVGLPLGLRWGAFELDWRPALRIPLGAEETPQVLGTRRHGASLGLEWLAFALRVHLDGLAW